MTQQKLLPLYLIALILTLPLMLYIIRPHVIHNHYPQFMVVMVNSYPNLLEAVCGFMALVIAFQWLQRCFPNGLDRINHVKRNAVITLITSLYVFSRELKLHHLGGSNTYDLNDMIASITGIILVNLLFQQNWKTSQTE